MKRILFSMICTLAAGWLPSCAEHHKEVVTEVQTAKSFKEQFSLAWKMGSEINSQVLLYEMPQGFQLYAFQEADRWQEVLTIVQQEKEKAGLEISSTWAKNCGQGGTCIYRGSDQNANNEAAKKYLQTHDFRICPVGNGVIEVYIIPRK